MFIKLIFLILGGTSFAHAGADPWACGPGKITVRFADSRVQTEAGRVCVDAKKFFMSGSCHSLQKACPAIEAALKGTARTIASSNYGTPASHACTAAGGQYQTMKIEFAKHEWSSSRCVVERSFIDTETFLRISLDPLRYLMDPK